MKKTLVIFKKEIKDILRDRRTIVMMVIIPLLILPLLMNLVVGISISQARKAEARILKVGLITNGCAGEFRARLQKQTDMTIREDIKNDDIKNLIDKKEVDIALVFDPDFDRQIKAQKSGGVKLYYKLSSENEIAKRRIVRLINEFKNELVALRLQGLNLDRSFVDAVEITEFDLSSTKEKIGEYVGGFLPYIFVIFCFMGAMYPAIDLAAGEKERATIETLLASPASRLEIVLGKFLVVTLAGVITAAISILGIYLSINRTREIPPEIFKELIRIVEWKSILLLLSLLIPMCVLFAAVLLSISIFARSFKEAQSAMAPINFIVIVPAAIGLVPGTKLNAITALIPILNVSLATKQIIAGSIQLGLLLEVYLSLFFLAGLSLYFCIQWFNRESVIFRSV
jgi:sodium transport system permease protein